MILALGGWSLYDKVLRTDSGVAACKALRDGKQTVNGEKRTDTSMSEKQYRALRKVFEDSRYDDLRDHGTKLMDLVWQISKLGPEPGMGALVYISPLTEQVTGLQSACADHGVIVDLNMGK